MNRYIVQTFDQSSEVCVVLCADERERDSEAQMCLIDPGTNLLIFLDVFPDGNTHAWKPSKAYCDDLLDELKED